MLKVLTITEPCLSSLTQAISIFFNWSLNKVLDWIVSSPLCTILILPFYINSLNVFQICFRSTTISSISFESGVDDVFVLLIWFCLHSSMLCLIWTAFTSSWCIAKFITCYFFMVSMSSITPISTSLSSTIYFKSPCIKLTKWVWIYMLLMSS